MANTRITNLNEDTTPADDDLVATVDISDTTQSAQGSTKKVQAQNLVVKKLRTSTGPAVLTVGAVADGEFLKRSGTSIISAAAGGGGLGDVVGPSGATDNALARFDTTTGKLIQNSTVTVDDNGAVTVPEIAAPSTPAAGKVSIYAKADGHVYIKDDAGTETDLASVGGGTPGGSDTQVQFNSAGSFGGHASFTFTSGGTPQLAVPGGSSSAVGLGIGSTTQGFSNVTGGIGFLTGSTYTMLIHNGLSMKSNAGLFFSSNNTPEGSNDVAIVRHGTNKLRIAAGFPYNNWADLTLRACEHNADTYANRPGTPVKGMVICVTDSTVNTFGATVAGGGSNSVLAWFNGTNWTVIGI